LAKGVGELVEQIGRGKISVFIAGGLDDLTLGTDPNMVRKMLNAADNPEGVLVLMDLGSSVLSVEMAIEEMQEKQRSRILVCDAPFVEGALAAAAQLAAGSTIQEAAEEARRALEPKITQLESSAKSSASPSIKSEVAVTINNPLGLHIRPAASIVQTARRFKGEITIRNITRESTAVSAKSLNAIMLLDVRKGHKVAIGASGPDADQALRDLTALISSNFGESELSDPIRSNYHVSPSIPNSLTGIPVSPGIAVGPAMVVQTRPETTGRREAADPQLEWTRLCSALDSSSRELSSIRQQTVKHIGEYEAAIFGAHILFLDDSVLLDSLRQLIFTERLSAESAWHTKIQAMSSNYERSENPMLQSRAADLRDVGNRVMSKLTGSITSQTTVAGQPFIVVATDLTPSETTSLASPDTLAICIARGGPTSHASILARRLGIPAIVGLGENLMKINNGTLLAVDGEIGRVWIAPDAVLQNELETRQKTWLSSRQSFNSARLKPAISLDGRHIVVSANVGNLEDARSGMEFGAEGIGLLRTEFLYLNRQSPPGEMEQIRTYSEIFEVVGQNPIIVRTFDIGGDKIVPYIDFHEENPFFGSRGIRLSLERTDLLRTQLRAILRAGANFTVKVMFPMISTVEEIRRARAFIDDVGEKLQTERLPMPRRIEVGVMAEIPSAALIAEMIAPLVDFFSLGTNDLIQYTMAADRTNPKTWPLADGMNPAILRLIKHVVDSAHNHGKWVGLCGELAGDPVAVPVLLGLGVDELSVTPPSIPEIKALIRRINIGEVRKMAKLALTKESGEEVRNMVLSRLQRN
jgi:phosphocarrier protein FPr